jgi:hypothetical protein
MRRIRLLTGGFALVAFVVPIRAVVLPPGPKVVVTWASIGAGTSYYVQSSTNLSTWTTVASTAATNVSLSLNANAMSAFRLLVSNAPPQSATLAWNPSVPASDVVGYNIYYGGATGNYTNVIDVGLATNGVVTNLLAGGTYYFVTTAYTSTDVESGYSNEVAWQCPLLLNIQQSP